jgi:hypothetical protein
MSAVYHVADNKQATVLVGLDTSAAFNTISRDVLMDCLSADFGV